MIGGGGICDEVLTYIEEWVPDDHSNEYGFQEELREYLDVQLNESGNSRGPVGLGDEMRDQFPVRKEYGKSQADVAVGDTVGIEMKHNLTNGRINELSGQIRKYKKEFPCVVVVACGIDHIGGWRELQNEYSGVSTVGMQMNEGKVHFIHKKEEHFGKDPSEVREDEGGFLDGGGLF